MKKNTALLIAFLFLLATLSGCGDSSDGVSTDADASTPDAAQVTAENSAETNNGDATTLTVWQLKPEIAETLPIVFEAYMEKNPHINIVVDRPGGTDYDTTIKAQMASNVYPDLYMVNSYSIMESFARGGNAIAITDQAFTQNFVDDFLPSISVDGEIYGVPVETDGVGIIYNRDLFIQAGIEDVPKTLSEMQDVCNTLKAKGITPFSVGFQDSWTLNHTFSLIHGESMNAREFTQNMNVGEDSFHNPELDHVFDFLDLMVANCNDKPSDSDYSNMCTLFGQGESAMMVCGMWGMTSVLMVNPDINIGVFAVPVSEDPADARLCTDNAAVFCIPPQSPNQEEALKLLEWMSGEEFSQLYAEKCGIFMPTKGAALPLDARSGWEDIKAYMDSGNITSLPFLYYPPGFDSGVALQSYFMGSFDQNQVRDAWDEMWSSLVM